MATDSVGISNQTLEVMHTEGAGAHQQHMAEIKSDIATNNFIVRASAGKQFDQLAPTQARAVKKILDLPKLQQPS